MKTKTLKGLQLIEMVLGVAITALGLSFMMKSGLGQTAVVAFTQNLAFLTRLKSGTLIIIFNLQLRPDSDFNSTAAVSQAAAAAGAGRLAAGTDRQRVLL